MDQERWHQVESLFLEAVELDAAGRIAFLNERCAADPELRREVESMLASDHPQDSIIESTVAKFIQSQDNASGRMVGPYRLGREIGHGGMGAVYEAVRMDGEFTRRVAIKLMRRSFETEQFLPRFLAERQILARLDHPNIARLLDGGTTPEGEPYIVMELVDGEPITKYCTRVEPSLLERLRLFLAVCDAVRHAHQNLVVHRDLKPSNIMVTTEGQVKLLDFGIAKLLEEGPVETTAPLTMAGLRLLTPEYSSPEQIRGMAVNTSTDVYSLGAVLYEMLTGVLAHKFSSRTEAVIVKAVCETEVVRPSLATTKLDKRLAGDLDNVLLMALRKDPARRYHSVEQFAGDVRRYLADLPVTARSETLFYRVGKFARRNRAQLTAAALVALSLIIGTGVAVNQARRAERRFQQVRQLANAFMIDVDEQVRSLPGAMAARRTVVRIGLDYLENLGREARSDPGLELEVATAYLRIGDAQGFPVAPNLGQPKEALESYRKALAILERLSRNDPDPEVLRKLARAYHRTGFLLRTLGDVNAAKTVAAKGLSIAEQLYAADRSLPETVRTRMELLHLNGEILDATGAPEEGWKLIERSFASLQQWAREQPSPESQEALAMGHWRLSRGSQLPRDPEKALFDANEAIRMLEELISDNPSNERLRRNLWNATAVLSMILFQSTDPKRQAEAYPTFDRALRMAGEILKGDPLNRRAVSDLYLTYSQGCRIRFRLDMGQGLAMCRKAERLAEEMVTEAPGILTRARMQTAWVLREMGRHDEAVQLLTVARDAQLAENRNKPEPEGFELMKEVEQDLQKARAAN